MRCAAGSRSAGGESRGNHPRHGAWHRYPWRAAGGNSGRRATVHFRGSQRAGGTVSILLVDIGNTRAKFAVLRGARLSAARALPHRGGAAGVAALVRAAPRDVERVVAVCVMGARYERALAAAVHARFGLRTEFIRS